MLKYVVDFDVETLGVGRGEREGGGEFSLYFWRSFLKVIIFCALL